MTNERRIFCQDHCATCDRHFSGLGAFDAHRVDGECIEPWSLHHPKDATRPTLQIRTSEGYCDKMPGVWVNGQHGADAHPVTIWQKYITPEAQERFSALNKGRSRVS